MPSTATTSLRLEQQADGENSGVWGQKQNNNHVLIEQAIAGRTTLSVAGGVDVTLVATNYVSDQARNKVIELTGLLTGNINVIVPTAVKTWTFYNNTTGAFSLTVKGSTGTGIAIPQGHKVHLYHDGTNVVEELSYATKLAQRDGSNLYAADSGAANAYVVTPIGTAPTLAAGLEVRFKAANANTTTSTLNAWGLGVQTILRPDGSALVANDITTTAITKTVWNGANWILVSLPGSIKSMATQAAGAVAITGGTVDGITLDGGTF